MDRKIQEKREFACSVWDFFRTVDEELLECNLCDCRLLCPKVDTSDMTHHLQKSHPEELMNGQACDIVEFVKEHPVLNDRMVSCQGVGGTELHPQMYFIDHCLGLDILKSTKCEMIVPASEEPSRCRFCAKLSEGQNKSNDLAVEKKPRNIGLSEIDQVVKDEPKPDRNSSSLVEVYFTDPDEDFDSDEGIEETDVKGGLTQHQKDLPNLSLESNAADQDINALSRHNILKDQESGSEDKHCGYSRETDSDSKFEAEAISQSHNDSKYKEKSLVGKYFTSILDGYASCNQCGAQVQCPTSSTCQMLSHLQDSHPVEYREMLMKSAERVQAEAKPTMDIEELMRIHEETKKEAEQNCNALREDKNIKNQESSNENENYGYPRETDSDGKSEADVISLPHNDSNYKKKSSTSLVWKYFTSIWDGSASCNKCGAQVQCPRSSTSQMLSHLQDSHPVECREMLMKSAERAKAEAKPTMDIEELMRMHEEDKKDNFSTLGSVETLERIRAPSYSNPELWKTTTEANLTRTSRRKVKILHFPFLHISAM